MRKIIQITTLAQPSGPDWNAWMEVRALCDDGTVWVTENGGPWIQMPPIPQYDKPTNEAHDAARKETI